MGPGTRRQLKRAETLNKNVRGLVWWMTSIGRRSSTATGNEHVCGYMASFSEVLNVHEVFHLTSSISGIPGHPKGCLFIAP